MGIHGILLVKYASIDMNIFDLPFSNFTIEEWILFYGGIISFLGIFWLGISILMWRDKYK